jgi:tRNA pseudouridine38-40 synthase
MKLVLELSFVGSAYHGWQVQKNAPSVQGCLQNACERLLESPCRITGCSRTDAGVHAKRFYCTLENDSVKEFPEEAFPRAITPFLPPDVSVLSAQKAGEDFHPRYSALGKEYEYLIYRAARPDPFLSGRAWMLCDPRLDPKKMDRAARAIEGRRDFTSFCAAGGKVTDKTRSVYYCRVYEDGDLVRLRVCADGFLYNMVRIITGTLVDHAYGRIDDLSAVLEGKNRALAGRTAPAEGLYLRRVFYEASALEEAKRAALEKNENEKHADF